MVKRLGLVKITRQSAADLFDLGVPLVLAPSKVNDYHFFDGWHLAMRVDSQRYLAEGHTFSRLENSFNAHADAETGNAAWFVDEKYVGGPKRRPRRR
jgi:hypothetical protein